MTNLPVSNSLTPANLPPAVDSAHRQVQAHPEFKDWNSAYNLLTEMDGKNALVLTRMEYGKDKVDPYNWDGLSGFKKIFNSYDVDEQNARLFLHVPSSLPSGKVPHFGTSLLTWDYLPVSSGNYGMLNNKGMVVVKTPNGEVTLTSNQANKFRQKLLVDRKKLHESVPKDFVDFIADKIHKAIPTYWVNELLTDWVGDMRVEYLWLPKVKVTLPSKGTKAPPPLPKSTCEVVCQDHGGGCVYNSFPTMNDSYLKPGQKAYQIVCKNGFVFESFGDKDAAGRLVYMYAGDLSGLGSGSPLPKSDLSKSNCEIVCKDRAGCSYDSGSTMVDSYLKPGQKAYQIVCNNGHFFESFGDKDAAGNLVYTYAGDIKIHKANKIKVDTGSPLPQETPPSGSAGGSMSALLPDRKAPKLGSVGKFRFRYETVQSGDTLGTFCRRNGLTRQQFFELNPAKPRISLGGDEYTTLLQEQEECLVQVVF